MKREWIVLLEASSGLGLGLTDMVSICKHLQYRKQQQAKEAVRLGPNGERPRLEFLTCSCVDVASSVYGVDLSQSKQYVSWNVGTSYFRHSFLWQAKPQGTLVGMRDRDAG